MRNDTVSRPTLDGAVLPDDAGYDAARQPWNVAVDQRPAAVVYPTDARQVAAAVRAAAEVGLRVAPQGTGHNATPLAPALGDALLLRTTRMTAVTIDPDRRIARAESGAVWEDVTVPAGHAGLAALHGSSPDVGVAGYSLGGGLGWYAREHGMQTNNLTAVELVTADGELVRADADHEPDLFWAVRGGGGNFGVVTAFEFTLFPITTAYAGHLVWDWRDAERVLRRFAEWAPDAPDQVTTAFRILQMPPIPQVPEFVRGRKIAMINGAVLGDDAAAERILAPLRELRPEIDTFGRMPAPALVRLHLDPEGPTPGIGGTLTLGSLPSGGVDALIAATGPDSGTSMLVAAELRQLGGALGRPHPGAGALPAIPGDFLFFTVGLPMAAEDPARMHADLVRAQTALAPWATGWKYLNFVESAGEDVSSGYDPRAWARLRAVRDRVDPNGLFVANHAIPGAAAPDQAAV